MAKYTTTIKTDSTATFLCNVVKKRDNPSFKYTIMGYGSFSTGTLSWFVSPDQSSSGSNLIPMTDLTDTALTMTSNKMFDGELGGVGSKNTDRLTIWVTMSGSSSACNVIASVYDNNG